MKSNPSRLVCTFAAAVAAAAAASSHAQQGGLAQIDIELRGEVVAQQREVRLGDVANLRTTDLAAIRRLVALPLGQAPRPGTESVLDREMLTRWIRGQLGIAGEQLAWRGAQRSRLKAAQQVLPAPQIEQTARAALQQWLAARSRRFDIESAGIRQDIDLPPGRLELKARPLPAAGKPASRMVVWVDAWVDGGFARTVPVSFSVEAYEQAWVARSNIAAGAAVMPTMLEKREVDVAARPDAMLAELGSAGERMRSLRSLKAGEPLSASNARPQMAVDRGDWVTLQLNTGAMRMESRAEALQPGDLGQIVKVRVAGAAHPVEALVVDRGRVEAMP